MRKLLTVCGLLLALVSTNALATLYGTLLSEKDTGSVLVEIDPTNGSLIRQIGNIGYNVSGLTYDNTNGTLYATTTNWDSNFANGLLTINVTSGAGTPVGSGAGIWVNVPSVNSSGQMYGWTQRSRDAVLWNKIAGTVTVLGDSNVETSAQSLAFDNNDILYLLNGDLNLYTINTSTGVATLVGPVTGSSGRSLHHGDFNPANNRLYAVNSGFIERPWSIDVVDISTRTVVATLPTVDDLHTLAFAGPPPSTAAPVPALSSWAMFALALLLALAATLLPRRPRGRFKR